jgi:hypothetical protein
MLLERRLKKIEDSVGEKNKICSPAIIWLYADDNAEEILKRLKVKYGEDYAPSIIIKSTATRENAKEKHGYCYKEIDEL